jgi:hypothetical protein
MFSRATILRLLDDLNLQTHAEAETFALRFGLEEILSGNYIAEKKASVARYLIANPERLGPDGANICVEIIEWLIKRYSDRNPANRFPVLANLLDHDGYELGKDGLRRKLPSLLPIVQQEDQLMALLADRGFSTAIGHYRQAVAAHGRGEWAGANAQLRSFVEDVLNSIQGIISPGNYSDGNSRREALAKSGFFKRDLNEWLDGGKGFMQGFWKRLHPEGSHPGLSEADDATFRLHIVIVVVHYLMRRLSGFTTYEGGE